MLGQAPLPTAQGLAGNLPIGMTLVEGRSPFSARPSQEIVTLDLDPIAGALHWADGPSGKGVEKSQVVMDAKPITPLSRSVSHPLSETLVFSGWIKWPHNCEHPSSPCLDPQVPPPASEALDLCSAHLLLHLGPQCWQFFYTLLLLAQ